VVRKISACFWDVKFASNAQVFLEKEEKMVKIGKKSEKLGKIGKKVMKKWRFSGRLKEGVRF